MQDGEIRYASNLFPPLGIQNTRLHRSRALLRFVRFWTAATGSSNTPCSSAGCCASEPPSRLAAPWPFHHLAASQSATAPVLSSASPRSRKPSIPQVFDGGAIHRTV